MKTRLLFLFLLALPASAAFAAVAACLPDLIAYAEAQAPTPV